MQEHGSDAAAHAVMDSTLPLWFKPEKFLEPEFSAEAYVADLKRYVPLETLRGELQQHVTALQSRLVEVINEDYNDFVSLSTRLTNVDGAVLRMQRPLLELQGRLEGARAAVADRAAELQNGLARRQAVAAARELLELLQDTSHVMSKVEKLLGELQPATAAGAATGGAGAQQQKQQQQGSVLANGDVATGGAGAAAGAGPGGADGVQQQQQQQQAGADSELEARCRLLDRVCSEVARLNFYSAKGQDLALIRKLQPRIAAAAERLQAELGTAMRGALAAGQPTALAICLHAYAALGVPQAAEQVVREVLVAPAVRAAVAAAAAAAPAAPAGAAAPAGGCAAGAAAGGLPALLPALVAELSGRLGGVLGQALASCASSESFDFLGGSVLPEVVAALEDAMPGVFSPGVPSAFHANYCATMRFLDELEGHCSSVAQVQQFRHSASYQALMKKWSLPVYFSMRFQDIAGGLEGQLAAPMLDRRPAAGGPGEPAFALPPAAAVWRGLRRCLEPDVFLQQLADRFVRLAMQLLARFATWAQQGMKQRAEKQAQEQQGAAAGAPAAAVAAALANAGSSGALTAAAAAQQQQQNGGEEARAEPAWWEAATPEQLSLLAADMATLGDAVLSLYVPALSKLVQGQETSEAVVLAFIESASQLEGAGAALLAALADSLTDQCVVVLRQLRGIVATFRMTKRAQPDRPSHYVSAILAPLQSFLAGEAAGRLGEAARAGLTQAVVAGISSRYQQLANDTLSTVRKTESSLKRLKTRQRAGGDADGSSGGAGDTDKMISMQLLLDVQEFGRLAGAAGVDLAQVESYQQLWATVSAPPPAEEAPAS